MSHSIYHQIFKAIHVHYNVNDKLVQHNSDALLRYLENIAVMLWFDNIGMIWNILDMRHVTLYWNLLDLLIKGCSKSVLLDFRPSPRWPPKVLVGCMKWEFIFLSFSPGSDYKIKNIVGRARSLEVKKENLLWNRYSISVNFGKLFYPLNFLKTAPVWKFILDRGFFFLGLLI